MDHVDWTILKSFLNQRRIARYSLRWKHSNQCPWYHSSTKVIKTITKFNIITWTGTQVRFKRLQEHKKKLHSSWQNNCEHKNTCNENWETNYKFWTPQILATPWRFITMKILPQGYKPHYQIYRLQNLNIASHEYEYILYNTLYEQHTLQSH
jgi:hypothetical protein